MNTVKAKDIGRVFRTSFELLKVYPKSLYYGFRYKDTFSDIETYCMFIGYPRSGHSLIGSLLDAHPDVIVAQELDALKFLYAGFRKEQILYLILERSMVFAKSGGKHGKYNYSVPNQWQGRFRRLRVIGDKKGWSSTLRLRAKPSLLDKLRKTFNVKLRFLHVVRNPYDTISTMFIKSDNWSLEETIEHYFLLCETVSEVKRRLKEEEVFELRHEDFISNPREYLERLCRFLGVDAGEDYLKDCAGIVFKNPHRSRFDLNWDLKLIELVKARSLSFPFLKGYSYEEI
ncbi:hypothetical protein HRbin37_01900 [bacterium HR37]|nr:hypothetical protein HRbin37_01900 [bacterium HR37]